MRPSCGAESVSASDKPDWAAVAAGYSPRVQIEVERQQLLEHRDRMLQLRAGNKVSAPPKLPPRPKVKLTGTTHLVVGDAHFHPGDPCPHRATWLGRAITDLQPSVVIDIGDWWSCDSLNSFDRPGSKSFEGRRYHQDIDAGVLAQERVREQLDDWNRGRRKASRLEPRMIRTLGNHEYRIDRVLEESPRLLGVIGTEDLLSREFGWEEISFLEPILIDGIVYQHYFDKGGRAPGYSTKHLAANTLAQTHRTCVFGHTHRFDYFEEPAGNGKIQVVNAGCYFSHEEPYAGNDNKRWRRGLLVLRNVVNGRFDFEWLGMDVVEARYG